MNWRSWNDFGPRREQRRVEARVRGRRLGDRRYQRRSLGWLVAVTMVVVVAAVAEMVVVVVVEWRQGVGTGGKWGQINANMCGKLHRDRSQDPRGKRGLYVFLCHSLSRNPLCTLSASIYSISHFVSLCLRLSPFFLLVLSRGFCLAFLWNISLFRSTSFSFINIIDNLYWLNWLILLIINWFINSNFLEELLKKAMKLYITINGIYIFYFFIKCNVIRTN